MKTSTVFAHDVIQRLQERNGLTLHSQTWQNEYVDVF